ncbi:hypothetical protein Tcan_13373 [Toxocara canis]|uniref:Uncharacterized protein n=1 Tax=Toxocara canis TaxID=6265 RepID=A0A0B2V7G6_TOXCA|nr:hypothetical protein Tcan_13373 [Toxocara canis]
MRSGVAEFQKLHEHLAALRRAGKHEEGLKYCTEGCYFMTPFREPYGIKGVAEFQKLHERFIALRKAGKEDETLKYCTEGCYFMSPFSEPQSVKDAIETMKDPKLQEMSKAETTITVDAVEVSGDFAGDRGRFVVKDKDGEKKGRSQTEENQTKIVGHQDKELLRQLAQSEYPNALCDKYSSLMKFIKYYYD